MERRGLIFASPFGDYVIVLDAWINLASELRIATEAGIRHGNDELVGARAVRGAVRGIGAAHVSRGGRRSGATETTNGGASGRKSAVLKLAGDVASAGQEDRQAEDGSGSNSSASDVCVERNRSHAGERLDASERGSGSGRLDNRVAVDVGSGDGDNRRVRPSGDHVATSSAVKDGNATDDGSAVQCGGNARVDRLRCANRIRRSRCGSAKRNEDLINRNGRDGRKAAVAINEAVFADSLKTEDVGSIGNPSGSAVVGDGDVGRAERQGEAGRGDIVLLTNNEGMTDSAGKGAEVSPGRVVDGKRARIGNVGSDCSANDELTHVFCFFG